MVARARVRFEVGFEEIATVASDLLEAPFGASDRYLIMRLYFH